MGWNFVIKKRQMLWDDDAFEECDDVTMTMYIEELKHQLSTKVPMIVAYGTLGLWKGNRFVSKIFSETTIYEAIKLSMDSGSTSTKIYLEEGGDLIMEQVHHDGTNILKFRGIDAGTTSLAIDILNNPTKVGCPEHPSKEFTKTLDLVTYNLVPLSL